MQLLCILPFVSQSHMSCKNPSNAEVDWFAAFKVPQISDQTASHQSGLGYFYRDDATSLSEGPSDVGSSTKNPLYYSTIPMYSGNPNIGYLLINDQPPNGTIPSSRAHMKGILIFDSDDGIYIEHSSPNFPPDPKVTKAYSYPSSSSIYGQSFLCLDLAHSQINLFAKGLLIDRPGIYSYNFPSFTHTSIPALQDVVDGNWDKTNPTMQQAITVGKSTFTLFAKSATWGKDLYHDLLAPAFGADIDAETWCNGIGTMDSYCDGTYKALNVLNLSFGKVNWIRNKDHSKWGLSGNNVFIGGINRQNSQTRRGGGGFAKNDQKWASEMKSVIQSVQQC